MYQIRKIFIYYFEVLDESLEFRFLVWSMNTLSICSSLIMFVTHRTFFVFTCRNSKKLEKRSIYKYNIDLNVAIRVQWNSFNSQPEILWYDFSLLDSMICSLFIFKIDQNCLMNNFKSNYLLLQIMEINLWKLYYCFYSSTIFLKYADTSLNKYIYIYICKYISFIKRHSMNNWGLFSSETRFF